MIKVLFINHTAEHTSVARIINSIRDSKDIDSIICYGRGRKTTDSNSYRFTNIIGNSISFVNTLLFNRNGLSNTRETKKLIDVIKKYNPDVIHIHCLLGYYVNYEVLFNFLSTYNKPVIYTMHNCWPITGYCQHFDCIKCDQYKTGCKNCKLKFTYPFSLFKQNINKQYINKSKLFNSLNDLTIVTPSKWLKNIVSQSYLNKKNIVLINNGIDLSQFYPSTKKRDDFTILFVANIWTIEKGLNEIEKIVRSIDKNIKIVIVGKISPSSYLKERCACVGRTNNIASLCEYYSSCHLFINPTLEDTYPTVNIESLACGTPVITYNTGGSPEIIDDKTGICIKKHDYIEMAETINNQYHNYLFNVIDCINRSKQFSKHSMVNKYISLYRKLCNINIK